MPQASDIKLWDDYSEDHWLRPYGGTQVIVIDDQWFSDRTIGINPHARKRLEQRLNITFRFFSPDKKNNWDDEWFHSELEKIKKECKTPSAILLDLMYGKEIDPFNGSGKKFLSIIAQDNYMSDVPILIITAGEESAELLTELKTVGGSLEDFIEKNAPPDQPFSERLEFKLLMWGFLSDPNMSAFSKSMRRIAQLMRKVVLNPKMETIKNEKIPQSLLFVGESGNGKDYLAKYLVTKLSDRKDPYKEITFTNFNKESAAPTLFGTKPHGSAKGKINVDIGTGKKTSVASGYTETLAQTGLFTEADGGTVFLNELGNADPEVQKKVLSFLDSREICPLFSSQVIPTKRPYNVWVIMSMQPMHEENLQDLKTRQGQMTTIRIPSLQERKEDILPLAMLVIDKDLKATSCFNPDALEWLQNNSLNYSIRELQGIISNLTHISAKLPYTKKEINEACKLSSTYKNEDSSTLEVGTVFNHADIANMAEIPLSSDYRENMLHEFERHMQPFKRQMAEYTLWALKIKKKTNGDPNYPATWEYMTGENKSGRSSEVQRAIGDCIFEGFTDEEIINHIKDSELLTSAVFNCGAQRKNEERLARLNKIEKALEAYSG